MYTIVTTRFNNETLESNYAYRRKHGFACMYCCPQELSPKIHYNTPVFVIEMNNQKNQIEGIGLIKNKYETNKYLDFIILKFLSNMSILLIDIHFLLVKLDFPILSSL